MTETETRTDSGTEEIAVAWLAADVVVIDGAGRVAVIGRRWGPYVGLPALPGGHVAPAEAEATHTAAARELEEETGIEVDPEALVYLGTWARPGRDPRGRYVTDAYLARVPTGTALRAGSDAARAAWVHPEDLPERIAFDHALIIETALRHLGQL